MTGIKRNTDPLKGPPDGVEADIQTVLTRFIRAAQKKGEGKTQRTIKDQSAASCRVLCSYSEGTIGFSIRSKDLMLTLRIDELMAIVKEAAEASRAFIDTLPEHELTDEMLEELWRELEDVPFDEAESPHGLILAGPWRHFPAGVDRGDIWTWFDVLHSRGVAYLMGETET